MGERLELKVMTTFALVGTLLVSSLSGCSLFEDKKEHTASGDREPTWPYASMEATLDTTEPEKETLTEAEITEPEATEPEATEPETTEPETTEPETTEPETTEPETTEPETTETEPPTTEIKEYFPDEIIHPIIGTGEIIASILNVREYPSMDADVVDGLKRGTRVDVYDYEIVDGEFWGAIDGGWISMQWVALDGDVVGTWYELQGVDESTHEDLYGFWTLERDNEFRYVVYGFSEDQVRQVSKSGGTFQMDENRISFDFTYGGADITLAGITTKVPGNITCNWNVFGRTMTLQEASKSVLTRGTVEKLREQLQEGD